MEDARYEDPLIRLAGGFLVIRRYYFPLATARKIQLSRVRVAREHRLGNPTGRLRFWGSSDLRRWFNLDPGRSRKTRAFVLDLGGWVRPVVTPDEPEFFARALEAAGVRLERGSSPN